MKYCIAGRSDLKLSAIGMGCWQFSGGPMWGDQEDAESVRAVHAALDAGIILFDTAEGYGGGKSEEVLGKALKGRRHEAIVATKASGPTYAKDEMVAACETSLRRLGTDYIDLYQLHWPRPQAVAPDLILEAAETLKKSGKIRYFGVCNYGPKELSALLQHGTVVTNQLSYSLLWRGMEGEILPLVAEHRVGILTYSTLLHGLLSGKYETLDDLPEGRARTLHYSSDREGVRHGTPGQEDLTNRTLAAVRGLCADAGIPMVDAAYGWAMSRPGVSSVLAGARSVDQVLANARIADVEFPAGFLDALTEATEELHEVFGNQTDMWSFPGRMH